MNINLLTQGFEANSAFSAGNLLIKFFADTNFHTFTGISAFASQAGINGLFEHIESAKKHLSSITIITGVDLKGTSKEVKRLREEKKLPLREVAEALNIDTSKLGKIEKNNRKPRN